MIEYVLALLGHIVDAALIVVLGSSLGLGLVGVALGEVVLRGARAWLDYRRPA